MTVTKLAQEVGIEKAYLSRYLHAVMTPSVANLVKLADYFNCTTDYLLGRENENYPTSFKPCPPFSEQLMVLKKHFNCTWWHFYKTAHISSSRFYEWKNGKRTPTLDCIIFLADGFGCTVDFIIGRTEM
ncbi:MAG: helix-turn-helix domain-containing protein [Clostridia bacterium]|nr:helix-turn-helix domain-containing protein [Clostridia bacterium]